MALSTLARRSWKLCAAAEGFGFDAWSKKRGFYLSLERSVGKHEGSDKALIASSQFHCYVTPDLPDEASISTPNIFAPPGMLNVRTVAAQVREEDELLELMAERSEVADALLLVSGSDRHRQQGQEHWFDSCWMLEQAKYMKMDGEIPDWVELWAVANPMIETTIQKVKYKAKLGAETIITQPPLAWKPFKRWWDKVQKSRTCQSVRFIVGLPFITSTTNYQFWTKLCECQSQEDVKGILRKANNLSGQEEEKLWRNWNMQLIDRIAELHGLGGVHFMPLNSKAHKLAKDTLKHHLLPALQLDVDDEIRDEERPDSL
ncbi:hypothetical protein BSKO_10574 [Bryopsis sp. KO-2023]|nr:hypothetical protein BSKO_10574 [Bryopsis sp. KO-2023]